MIDPMNNPDSPNGQALKDRVRELQLGDRLDGKGAKGGTSTAWLPWMLCILMALTWAGVGIRWYKQTGGGASGTTTTDGAAKPKAGETGAGKQAAQGEIVLESKGYLIPSEQISISPIDVAGRVTELYIEEGKTFKKGEVLAVIDSTRFKAAEQEAAAQVLSARSKLDELKESTTLEISQAEFELAEAKAQMAEALFVWETAKATTGAAIAKLEVNQAAKKFEAAGERVKGLEKKLAIVRDEPRKLRINTAMRDVQVAESRYLQSKWSYDNCTILSPVTGVILTKKAEVGSLINPVVGGVSTNLCDMADLSKLEVDLEIQERDIARIRIGMICRIRSDAFPDRLYEGYVERMMPIANRARGIIPVRVIVILRNDEKQGEYLKPEMGVSVTFINLQSAVRAVTKMGIEIGDLVSEKFPPLPKKLPIPAPELKK
ncbi:MAG: efflux RND transporter periplasmic adaptor subunit [Planctomycetes bacterium]|nr:efflux RND transporter periplasmic adaptor subunit [Planctomycetota bacterium]